MNSNPLEQLYTEEEIQALKKMRNLLDSQYKNPVSFTSEEEQVLRNMIKIYETIVSFGRVGSLIKNMIIGAAAFLAALFFVYQWSTSGLKSILGIQ